MKISQIMRPKTLYKNVILEQIGKFQWCWTYHAIITKMQHQTCNILRKRSHYTQLNFNKYPLSLYGWMKHALEENEMNIEHIEKL